MSKTLGLRRLMLYRLTISGGILAVIIGVTVDYTHASEILNRENLADQEVAALHNIDVADVARLRTYRNLSNTALAEMSISRVHRVLWRLDNPRPDQPLGAAQYRRLLETGGFVVPDGSLNIALEQLEVVRQEAGRLFVPPQPAVGRDPSPGVPLSGKEPITIAGVPVGLLSLPDRAPASATAPDLSALPRGETDHGAGRLRFEIEPLPALGLENAAMPRAAAAPRGGLSPGRWRWLGPGNIGGRTRSILVHPTAAGVMWAGAVAGGIWKTADGGETWAPLADFLANLNVSTLSLTPNRPDLVFAGTGEGFYNLDAFRGAGIFRSIDGGAHWEQLASTRSNEFHYVNRVVINNDATMLLAATRRGLFISKDFTTIESSAVTFIRVPELAGRDLLDAKCSPVEPQHCVVSSWGHAVFVTTDFGTSWRQSTGLPPSSSSGGISGRVELAFARANSRVVYASVDSKQGEVYRSEDGGKTFQLQGQPEHLAGQGWYNNTIWADDPIDENLVLTGGLDLHRSEDGGQTFERISAWHLSPASAHADHHAIVSHPGYDGQGNRTVFFANDGGIYRHDDVRRAAERRGWVSLNNRFGVTQFYGAAGNAATGRIVAGAQDNGSVLYRPPPGNGTGPNGYTSMFGGDGGFVAADTTDANFFYGEYTHLRIHRSINGGERANYIYNGITDAGDNQNSLFIAPFILDPAEQSTMLAGGRSVWRSTNVRASTPVWQSIKPPTSSGPAGLVSAIETRRSLNRPSGRSNLLWVGYADGQVFISTDAQSTIPSWSRVDRNGGQPLPQRYVTRLRVHPDRHETVIATFAGYEAQNLWWTINNGRSWEPIGQNLPSVTIYDVAFHPADSQLMYAATELGVFASSDGGGRWWPTNQGPANVTVSELFWMGSRLIAVTHGRGLFWIDLSPETVAISDSRAPNAPMAAAVTEAPSTNNATRGFILPTDANNSR